MFFLRMKTGERRRLIEILKMRGVKHSKYVYPLEIGSKGIEISKKPLKKIDVK